MIGAAAAAIALVAPLGLSACSSSGGRDTAAPAGDCPTAPVNVVVSVDQWGDIVQELGGDCAEVKTVLASSAVEPHEFEPSPADAATFAKAQLVVVNGAGYDPWASKFAATSAPKAPVVDAGVVTETPAGSNPHLWYRPSAVVAGADAYRISAEIELDGHHLARLWLEGKDTQAVLEQIGDAEQMPSFLGEFADDIVEMVGDEVDRIEGRIREVIPRARSVDLEPD